MTDLEPSGVCKITQMQGKLPLKKITYPRSWEFSFCRYMNLLPLISLNSTSVNFSLIFFAFHFHKINMKINLYPKTNQQNWSVTSLNMARLACSLTNLMWYILGERGENKTYIWEMQVNPLLLNVLFHLIHNKIYIIRELGLDIFILLTDIFILL